MSDKIVISRSELENLLAGVVVSSATAGVSVGSGGLSLIEARAQQIAKDILTAIISHQDDSKR